MSPVERRSTLLGIPIGKWKPVPPGEKLYDHNPESPGNLVRKTLLGYPVVPVSLTVTDEDTIEFEVESLVLKGGEVDGILENKYQPTTYELHGDDINQVRSVGSDTPPVRQQVRWVPGKDQEED